MTGLLTLLLALAILGFIVWIILQIPMPDIVRKIILGVFVLVLLIWLIGQLGGGGISLPSLN